MKIKKLIYYILAAVLILIFWYFIASLVNQSRGNVFPTPTSVFRRFSEIINGKKLYANSIISHVSSSLLRWAIGYFFAAVFGVLLGLILGMSKLAYNLIMPIIHFIQFIPGLAWIPISLLLFGLGETSTIFMIFIIGITPVIINTTSGIQSVPRIYLKVSETLGASRSTIFFKVMMPAALLSIINGLRIGLANAWRVLIAAEMIVGSGAGLGYVIIQSRWSLDFESAFVAIIIISTIGMLIEKFVFRILEKEILWNMGFIKESD